MVVTMGQGVVVMTAVEGAVVTAEVRTATITGAITTATATTATTDTTATPTASVAMGMGAGTEAACKRRSRHGSRRKSRRRPGQVDGRQEAAVPGVLTLSKARQDLVQRQVRRQGMVRHCWSRSCLRQSSSRKQGRGGSRRQRREWMGQRADGNQKGDMQRREGQGK